MLGDYIFCHHKNLEKKNIIDSLRFTRGLKYLLEGLKVIESNQIKLSCNAATTPAVISPLNSDINFIYLVMPIQIRN